MELEHIHYGYPKRIGNLKMSRLHLTPKLKEGAKKIAFRK